jgi:hypothetical protein
MGDTGTTTTGLNLRAAPGTGSTIKETLAPGTRLVILGRQGDWLSVRVADSGHEGFVSGRFVRLPVAEIVTGWLRHDAEVQAAPLVPTHRRQPQLGAGAEAKTAARIWNAYGGLLQTLAARLAVEPEVGVAVLAVESGGTAFKDGRMVIRFENHVFFDRWGQQHPDAFARHFRFKTPQRWAGHEFRAEPGEPWRTFHGSQSAEWEVFKFAQALDRVAARRSISMGLAQIMGFNAANVGYESVDDMFDAFNDADGGERAQVVGLFDFVKGPTTTSEMVDALRDHAWLAFAKRYNGAGQAPDYANRLAASHAAAHSLLGA